MAEQSTMDPLERRLAASQAEVDRLSRRLQEEVAMRDRLIQVSTQLGSTLELSELLKLIMQSASEMFQVEASSVILVDEETGDLIFEVAVGEKGEAVSQQRIPGGQGIAGRVVQTGEAVIVPSASDDPNFFSGIDQAVGFRTRNLLAVPLKVRGRTIGVVEIINTRNRAEFSADDLRLAGGLAGQAAIAIDNARLYRQLSDALLMARMSYRL
jgi:sigma-B regulation protein RsbU (phosphoserine phosphatase)